METKVNYIVLEDGICYDNDDYDVYGAVLFDLNTREILTVKYGHGVDMPQRNESKELDLAIACGLITEEELKQVLVGNPKFNPIMLDDIAADKRLNIPCKVSNRCKYVKGDAILLKFIRQKDSYSRGGYIKVALVYSPSQNTLATIGMNSINISDEVWANINRKVKERMVDELSLGHLIHQYAYKMSYYSSDWRTFQQTQYQHLCLAFPYAPSPDISSARFPQMDRKKDAKMEELMVWANMRLPKGSPEEVEALATRTFNKYYKDELCIDIY